MEADPITQPAADLSKIIESAQRLGIELDEAEALHWIAAIAAAEAASQTDIAIDRQSGVFGHKIVMLDFSPEQLAHFRQVGQVVGFEDQPGVVETALALSGSSAQSKIQTYPGDADFFERVNIIAPDRAQACAILAEIMRSKALSASKGPTYQLIEAKFGSYPFDIIKDDHLVKAGAPISWKPEEIEAGQINTARPDGTPVSITWESVSLEPGWCKLDWVIADPQRGELANASNMLDVTWEAPDGSIIPLDGFLDPYFQEVYLEAESIPIFSKLAAHVSADALDDYVAALKREAKKYLAHDPKNYGKAAKRMYNIFRLTGQYQEAAFVRELFDEPAAMLYQVWSLIRTIDDSSQPGSTIGIGNLLSQTDSLILAVIKALEGDEETEIVRLLLHLRDSLANQKPNQGLSPEAEAARAEVINVVNNFFYSRLTAVPEIKAYMEALETE